MAKQRYVNTGEHVLRKNKLKKKVSTLQERGKALEIKFAKQCYKIYTGGKSNDYKKVSINYQMCIRDRKKSFYAVFFLCGIIYIIR